MDGRSLREFLTESREITPYKWVHPDDEVRAAARASKTPPDEGYHRTGFLGGSNPPLGVGVERMISARPPLRLGLLG
jgi:hypothetical protein